MKQDAAVTQPFYTDVLKNGIPGFNQQEQYSTSDIGDQVTKAKAGLNANLAGYGGALPSGFKESEDQDLALGGAKAFDQNMLSLLSQQFAAKMAAAGALNPQAPASGASAANSSILQAAPALTNSFWSNLVGGLVKGAGNIPFAFAG